MSNKQLLNVEENQLQELDLQQSLTKIYEFVEEIRERATSLLVVDQDGYEESSALWRKAHDCINFVEERRKAAGRPFAEKIAAINDRARSVTAPLAHVKAILNAKNAAYKRIVDEQERKRLAQVAKAAAFLDVKVEPVAAMPKTIRNEAIITHTIITKKFRITDAEKIPRRYLCPDEAAIKAAINGGVDFIEGIEIYEEKINRTRAR